MDKGKIAAELLGAVTKAKLQPKGTVDTTDGKLKSGYFSEIQLLSNWEIWIQPGLIQS